ncbi:hypothetical protein HDU91_006191, partial [Kappamyces sp. JEL0680]
MIYRFFLSTFALSMTTDSCAPTQATSNQPSGTDIKPLPKPSAITFPAGAVLQLDTTSPAWNQNWDHKADTGVKDAVRIMYLVRHGQYIYDPALEKEPLGELDDFAMNDCHRGLTEIGKQQAQLTGQRIAETLAHD